MDSVPILTIRYLPSMISPSFPYIGADFPSDRTAHFTPLARSSTPINFNAIGGADGGPAGTVETGPDFIVIDNVQLAEGAQANAPLSLTLELSTYYRVTHAP